MATTHTRLRLKIRTLRVSFADAGRRNAFDDGIRDRARVILQSLAVEIEAAGDPELRELLETARREIDATE